MECATSSKPPLHNNPVETRAGGFETELVKYMSKLPVFLERAETTTPLLSVGVLHWSRLEKWHHTHNRMVMQPAKSSNVHRTASACPRKHPQSNPGEEIPRDQYRKKKPKEHRGGFSVPDKQLGPNNTNAQDGCEKKGLKGDISRRKKSENKLRQRIHDGETKLSREEVKTKKVVQLVHSDDYCTQHHPCPFLPCKADSCSALAFADDADQNNILSAKISQCVPLSSNTSSRGKLSASSLLSVKHSTDERQDSNSHLAAVSENGRSISPFQRLSFSMGQARKTNTSQVDSMENYSKTVSQNITLSSVSEKDTTTTTSHLRRFLQPLLKHRATHSGNSVEGPRGITGCRTVNVNDSAQEKKAGSSMVKAILQVTVKNNQPLFTFAVNKETDVIAATQKKMGSSDEGECIISVYTFFSIKDHKRKSAWLNQRGRGQTHGIISNVVAQMRVSSSLPSGSIREFVLFSLELDLQLKNELAAIIVKMPRWFSTVQDHNALDKEVEDHVKDRVYEQDISATVILQSGVHSMPHKGGPSSLIQRWRAGGSCDCGGWDMGCNLRILTNQHNFSCKSSTTSNPFELFFLGEQEEEEHPFLSYKPIKEGIYSVVYDSSLSQLQAFSICMALAESRKMS